MRECTTLKQLTSLKCSHIIRGDNDRRGRLGQGITLLDNHLFYDDCTRFLAHAAKEVPPFDFTFLDPPFNQGKTIRHTLLTPVKRAFYQHIRTQ